MRGVPFPLLAALLGEPRWVPAPRLSFPSARLLWVSVCVRGLCCLRKSQPSSMGEQASGAPRAPQGCLVTPTFKAKGR